MSYEQNVETMKAAARQKGNEVRSTGRAILNVGTFVTFFAGLFLAAHAVEGKSPRAAHRYAAVHEHTERDSEVVALQRTLKREGFYRGRVDGIYGSKTAEALEKAEKAHASKKRRHTPGIVEDTLAAGINGAGHVAGAAVEGSFDVIDAVGKHF